MQLTEAQRQIAQSSKRFRTVNAGRRFGKTVLSVEELVSCAVMKKEGRVAYIAPTYQQARDIAWDMLVKRIEPIATKINESRLEITITNIHKGQSKLYLRGWESVETMRGQAFDLLIPDEVAMMRNFWAGWNEVLRPTLTDKKGSAVFISTPKGFNHFYDLCSISDPDWEHFHFTTYDNPHIPVEEIDDAKRQLPEDVFAQEYMADFRKQQGLVYKEFMRDRHITDEEPDSAKVVEYIAGVDFGYTNPTAVIHIKKDMNNNWWITDEWYRTGMSEEQIADYIFSCGFNKVYADPESPSAINALTRKHIHVSEVVKNKDSVVNGISQVRTLFKQGKIKIHRRCQNLISELESYRYPDKKPDHNDPEMPVKENDHALDALRYAIMTSNPVRHISPHDRMNVYIERQRNLANKAR